MKKRYIHIIIVATVAVLASCKDHPLFPDPGFDMVSEKNVTVRRDTADRYNISLHVVAPGGIEVIQIRNGRTLDMIEEFTQYKGQTDFRFNYEVDFGPIDKERDTVLMYNVCVRTADNRGYNSSYRIDLKKLSTPEIFLAGNNTIGVLGPVIGVLGLVTTGVYNPQVRKDFYRRGGAVFRTRI